MSDLIGKTYLGDGVYVEIDPCGLRLTTENGIGVSNTIYLDDSVLEALDCYRLRITLALDPERKKGT